MFNYFAWTDIACKSTLKAGSKLYNFQFIWQSDKFHIQPSTNQFTYLETSHELY